MPTNQFLPFGTGGGANVLDNASYSALSARLTGFVAGVAQSVQLNSVWRQSSVVAATLGQFIGDYGGQDALDDGNVANLEGSFVRALRRQSMNYYVAGGTANALTVTTSASAATVPGLVAGLPLRVLVATTNTGAATLNLDGLGAQAITHPDGTALLANELRAGAVVSLIWDGTRFQFQGNSVGRLLQIRQFTSSGTYTPTPGTAFIMAEVQGGGGGGGGCTLPSVGNCSLGSPGTCGAYASGIFTSAQIGASQTLTIGAGGAGGLAAAGSAGGTSSLGALVSAPGGVAGSVLNNQVPPTVNGTGTTSSLPSGANVVGFAGTAGAVTLAVSGTTGYGGQGGDSRFGRGGVQQGINSGGAGATGFGAGGAGSLINNGFGGTSNGGGGSAGIIIIWEFGL